MRWWEEPIILPKSTKRKIIFLPVKFSAYINHILTVKKARLSTANGIKINLNVKAFMK